MRNAAIAIGMLGSLCAMAGACASDTTQHEETQRTQFGVSVSLSTPANGATVVSSNLADGTLKDWILGTVTDSSATPITGVHCFIDDVDQRYALDGLWSTSVTYDFRPSLTPGSHTIVLRGWNSTGAFSDQTVNVNVSDGIVVSTVQDRDTVTSPLTIAGNAYALSGKNIVGMYIYVDNVAAWHMSNTNANPLAFTASVPLSVGPHNVVVQAWDSSSPQRVTQQKMRLNVVTGGDPTVVATGDIACNGSDYCNTGWCGNSDTGQLVSQLSPEYVLLAGDVQYEIGAYGDYFGTTATTCTTAAWGYDNTWGAKNPAGSFLARTMPSLGNHEYNGNDSSCAGLTTWDCYAKNNYFKYFDSSGAKFTTAGDFSKGYYSFDIPTSDPTQSWHVVMLNAGKCFSRDGSFCTDDATVAGSQANWLDADLRQHPYACTMVVWHQPLYSASDHMCQWTNERMRNYWNIMLAHNVDVVINGHEHDYERYAPQDADGNVDPAAGVTEFVVGTGGRDTAWVNGATHSCSGVCFNAQNKSCTCGSSADCVERQIVTPAKNMVYSAGCNGTNRALTTCSGHEIFGVLQMTLHPTSMDFAYKVAKTILPTGAQIPNDSGTITCH